MTRRSRTGAVASLRAVAPSLAAIDIERHADVLTRDLPRKEADRIARLARRCDGALIPALMEAERTRPHGPRRGLINVLRRADAERALMRAGWPLPAGAPPSPALRSRRVRFLFHSRGPLVANGYAARSVEVIGLAQEAGWTANALTRLGYPSDINRLRHAEVPAEEAYGGVPCRLLSDAGDGLRGRPLDDYLSAYTDAVVALEAASPPAILHAASSYHNGLAAAAAARRLGIACVYEARGLWEVTALSRGDVAAETVRFRLPARLEAEAASAAHAVLALSEGLKAELVRRGVSGDKIFVAPNCVASEDERTSANVAAARATLGLPDAALVVGYVGSVVDYEGLDLLIEALRLARARGTDVVGFIVGDGAALHRLTEAATAAGLGDRLVFHPRTSRAEATHLAGAADVLAMPRRDLPVTRIVPPIKVAEAYARGQPVIVSDVPALAELVEEGVTGRIVPPHDPNALAEAFAALAEDSEALRRMGAEARRVARGRFAPRTVAGTLKEAYAYAVRSAS